MPKTDFSAWLTSPLAIVKVGAEIDATTKEREEMGKCQEEHRRWEEIRKRKEEKKGGRGKREKILLVRGNKRPQETNAQSGRAAACIYGNDRVSTRSLPRTPDAEKFCIRPDFYITDSLEFCSYIGVIRTFTSTSISSSFVLFYFFFSGCSKEVQNRT